MGKDIKAKKLGKGLTQRNDGLCATFSLQKVLFDMEEEYAPSTVVQTFIAMGTLLKATRKNGVKPLCITLKSS